jgi:hypothetical protein
MGKKMSKIEEYLNEKVLSQIGIVKRLKDFDRIVSKELNDIHNVLIKYQEQMKGDIGLYKKMVASNIMKLDSDVDTFHQDTEEWMDKIQGE